MAAYMGRRPARWEREPIMNEGEIQQWVTERINKGPISDAALAEKMKRYMSPEPNTIKNQNIQRIVQFLETRNNPEPMAMVEGGKKHHKSRRNKKSKRKTHRNRK